LGKKGKRYSPRLQFQVVLEVLKGDRDAVEIARAHDLHPMTVSRWKREFLENGPAVFGKDTTLSSYEKKAAGSDLRLTGSSWKACRHGTPLRVECGRSSTQRRRATPRAAAPGRCTGPSSVLEGRTRQKIRPYCAMCGRKTWPTARSRAYGAPYSMSDMSSHQA
jgi:transposase-like protein